MFDTADFYKENPIASERVFERRKTVNFSINDLIGTHVASLFIESKSISYFEWGKYCFDWTRSLNNEIERLDGATFSDEAQRVIQKQKITDRIKEINAYEPYIVEDIERDQWEDEQ